MTHRTSPLISNGYSNILRSTSPPMTFEPTYHHTRLATIERHRPDLVVIRYREGTAFDVDGIAEALATSESLTGISAFGIVTVLPQDGDMSMDAVQQEHTTEGMNQRLRAHALVAPEGLFKKLAMIHYNYHPQSHPVRMFTNELEAINWVSATMVEPNL